MRIQAKIKLLATEAGGRKTPIHSRYKPRLYFSNGQETDGMISFDSKELILPGESANEMIEMIEFFNQLENVYANDDFVIKEGFREVGSGIIISIIKDKNNVN